MKKRILSFVLVLALALALLPTVASAADSDFAIENGVLTKYNGPGGDVTIPYGVTSIGDSTFYLCTSLTRVTIPNSVTSIGKRAFWGCTGLTRVTIGNNVTSIGVAAFAGCTGLTDVTIPDSVTSIGNGAFSGTSLRSVTIPGNVTSIEDNVFWNCTSLTSVTISDSVTSISNTAFDGTPWLESLGEFATVNGILFAYQGEDREVTIPDNVTSIGDGAFKDCTSLTSVTIPNSVTTIGSKAFVNCDKLTVYGHPGSAAETFCTQSSIPFSQLHTWATAWTADETAHWHVCTDEGCDITDYAACGETGAAYATHTGGTATCTAKAVCTACGQSYGDLAAHDFTGDYLSDADGHWHKCKNCTTTDTKTDHTGGTATCTAKAVCADCGQSYGELAAHVYDDQYDPDCNVCGAVRDVPKRDPVAPGTPRTGTMTAAGSKALTWTITEAGQVTLTTPPVQDETVLVGCYDNDYRFIGVKVLDTQHATRQIDPNTPNVKLFWLDGAQKPQSPSVTVWGR